MNSVVIGVAIAATLSAICTYVIHRLYLQPIEAERREVGELSELHLATIEALALAIDAKDQKDRVGGNHIRRVQVYPPASQKRSG